MPSYTGSLPLVVGCAHDDAGYPRCLARRASGPRPLQFPAFRLAALLPKPESADHLAQHAGVRGAPVAYEFVRLGVTEDRADLVAVHPVGGVGYRIEELFFALYLEMLGM